MFIFLLIKKIKNSEKIENHLNQKEKSMRIVTTTDNLETRLNLIEKTNESDRELFKAILKQCGFEFLENNLIKFPSEKLNHRLDLIYKCLIVLQSNY